MRAPSLHLMFFSDSLKENPKEKKRKDFNNNNRVLCFVTAREKKTRIYARCVDLTTSRTADNE